MSDGVECGYEFPPSEDTQFHGRTVEEVVVSEDAAEDNETRFELTLRGDEEKREISVDFRDALLTETEEGVRWRCRREAPAQGKQCLFHGDHEERGFSDADLTELFIELVNDEVNETASKWADLTVPAVPRNEDSRDAHKRRQKQFVGATFGRMDLTHELLDAPDRYPVDLRTVEMTAADWGKVKIQQTVRLGGLNATKSFEADEAAVNGKMLFADADVGSVSLDGADVGGKVPLDGADVGGKVSLDGADVEGTVSLGGADVEGTVSLGGADVEGKVSLRGADVGSVSLDGADVGLYVSLRGADVGSYVSLKRADVGSVSLDGADVGLYVSLKRADVGSVSLDDADVGEDVSLYGADVGEDVSLYGADVGEDVSLYGADVEGRVSLDDADVGEDVSLYGADVEGRVSLDDADVGSDVWLNDADVEGKVSLYGADVEGKVSLYGADVGSDVSLERADVGEGVSLDDADVEGKVSLSNTSVRRVSIGEDAKIERIEISHQATVGGIECTDSTVGTFELGTDDGVAPRIGTAVDDGSVLFEESVIDTLRFEDNCKIHGPIRVDNTEIRETLTFESDPYEHVGLAAVSLTDSIIESADITPEHPGADRHGDSPRESDLDRDTIFDFDNCTVGDIRDDSADDTGELAYNRFRFLRTSFDAFEFSKHRADFGDIDWAIHELRECGNHDIAVATPSEDAGDNESSAPLVEHEASALEDIHKKIETTERHDDSESGQSASGDDAKADGGTATGKARESEAESKPGDQETGAGSDTDDEGPDTAGREANDPSRPDVAQSEVPSESGTTASEQQSARRDDDTVLFRDPIKRVQALYSRSEPHDVVSKRCRAEDSVSESDDELLRKWRRTDSEVVTQVCETRLDGEMLSWSHRARLLYSRLPDSGEMTVNRPTLVVGLISMAQNESEEETGADEFEDVDEFTEHLTDRLRKWGRVSSDKMLGWDSFDGTSSEMSRRQKLSVRQVWKALAEGDRRRRQTLCWFLLQLPPVQAWSEHDKTVKQNIPDSISYGKQGLEESRNGNNPWRNVDTDDEDAEEILEQWAASDIVEAMLNMERAEDIVDTLCEPIEQCRVSDLIENKFNEAKKEALRNNGDLPTTREGLRNAVDATDDIDGAPRSVRNVTDGTKRGFVRRAYSKIDEEELREILRDSLSDEQLQDSSRVLHAQAGLENWDDGWEHELERTLRADIETLAARRAWEETPPDLFGTQDHEQALKNLEATYINAREGADDSGENVAAANFYMRERGYARRLHWYDRARHDSTSAARTNGKSPRDVDGTREAPDTEESVDSTQNGGEFDATLEIDDEPVDDDEVTANNESFWHTDSDGQFTFDMPDPDESALVIEYDELDMKFEFDTEDEEGRDVDDSKAGDDTDNDAGDGSETGDDTDADASDDSETGDADGDAGDNSETGDDTDADGDADDNSETGNDTDNDAGDNSETGNDTDDPGDDSETGDADDDPGDDGGDDVEVNLGNGTIAIVTVTVDNEDVEAEGTDDGLAVNLSEVDGIHNESEGYEMELLLDTEDKHNQGDNGDEDVEVDTSERSSSETTAVDADGDAETPTVTATDELSRERLDDDRDAWNWVKNAGLQLLTGYGEGPLRPIGWSILIIAAFSLVLWPLVGGPMRGVQASLGSFVTLVPANAVGIDDGSDAAILVAEVEGFLGMFLVAVFVFTLTRSIRR